VSIRRKLRTRIPALGRPQGERTPNLLAAFDADWYQRRYPETAHLADPLGHYLETGWKQGFDPCSLFDSSWYADHNPDAIAAGFSPLEHFVEFGWQEDRDPGPLFDVSWYLYQFPGRGGWSPDPMTHYRLDGWRTGHSPHPLFDGDWYLTQLAQGDAEGFAGDPLSHYLAEGWRSGFDPNPLFDSAWYVTHQAGHIGDDENPLAHYTQFGAVRGADPSALFSTTGYATRYPHCGGRVHALAHYLEFGRSEGVVLTHSDSPNRPAHTVRDVQIIGALPDPATFRSIAIIAAHDARGSVGLAVRHMCAALNDAGIGVVLSYDHPIAGEHAPDDPWHAIVTADHAGYDFFSWRLALEQFPIDAGFDEIFMLNDSVIGPFANLEPLLQAWRSLPFDVTGLMESSDPRAHLQSWGLRFGARCAQPQTLLSLYGSAAERTRKGDAIDFLEIPLAEHFRTRGFTTGSVFSQVTASTLTRNPAIYGWRELLLSGLPFVKREVIALPDALLERRRIDVSAAAAAVAGGMNEAAVGELFNDSLAQINRAPVFP
jgi:hypothetical protein